MLTIRAYNAAAAISLTDYAARSVCLRRGTIGRITATQEAVAHSRALMGNIDTLLAELTSELARKGWLWPAHRTLESPSQCRSSAQEARVRAEFMRDADARRMMGEIAKQYEDLAALIENAVLRQDEPRV